MLQITAEECRRRRPGRAVLAQPASTKEDILVAVEQAVRRQARRKGRIADVPMASIRQRWFGSAAEIPLEGLIALDEAIASIKAAGFRCSSAVDLSVLLYKEAEAVYSGYLRVSW